MLEKIRVQFIFTYYHKDQEMCELEFDPNITEKKFICKIFKELKEDVEDLWKISCCQFCKTENDLLPFLKERNGKYFFNYEINKDQDTKKWLKIKNNYCQKHLNL